VNKYQFIEQIGSLGKIVKPEKSHWDNGCHRSSAGSRNFRKTERMQYVVAPPLVSDFFSFSGFKILHWVLGTLPPCGSQYAWAMVQNGRTASDWKARQLEKNMCRWTCVVQPLITLLLCSYQLMSAGWTTHSLAGTACPIGNNALFELPPIVGVPGHPF
jgi:hypothetical protein